MKQSFITAVVFSITVTLSTLAQAQGGKEKGLRLGMQLTPTVSWFSSDEASLVDPEGAVIGYSFGMMGDWFFKEHYALSSGLLLNAMGGKLKYAALMPLEVKNGGMQFPKGAVTLRPTYLEIPLGFKFLTKDFRRIRFVGQCGYNQFFLLGAKVRHSGDLDKKDVKKEFSALMSACHFGMGAEYALGGNAYLTAGLVGVIGINDVTKSKTVGNIDPTNKLHSINFKLGIIF